MKKSKKQINKEFKQRIKKGANRGQKPTSVIMDKKTKSKHRRNIDKPNDFECGLSGIYS